MAFQVSPGINITEKDLTTVVPNVSTNIGAVAGAYQWGPVLETKSDPKEIIESYDQNIPKSFINKLKKLHDEGKRSGLPGSIDSWFKN